MMKTLLFLVVALLLCYDGKAQAPQSFPFQAVARDSFGTPLPNQLINARFSVRDGSSSGTVVYMETDSIVTDNLGMFTVNIGQGTVGSGTFSSINWGSAAKYLEVEIDPNGGSSYINLGASQMLSVPYALYSSGSGNSGWGINGNNNLADNSFLGSANGKRVVVKSGNETTASAAILGLQNANDSTGTALNLFLYDSLRNSNNRLAFDSSGFNLYVLNHSQNIGSGIQLGKEDVLITSFKDGDSGGGGIKISKDSLFVGTYAGDSFAGIVIQKDSVSFGSSNGGFYTMPRTVPQAGQVLTAPTGNGHLEWRAATTKNRFGITIDGLGDVITTGSKGFTQLNYNGTITGWTVLADQAGSCVIDVKRSNYSSFPTTTSIAGTDLPTLSSSQKNTNSTLSGWGSTAITSGDTFEFVVNSATTVKRVTLIIETTTTP